MQLCTTKWNVTGTQLGLLTHLQMDKWPSSPSSLWEQEGCLAFSFEAKIGGAAGQTKAVSSASGVLDHSYGWGWHTALFSAEAATVKDLVVPYLEEGRLNIKATFKQVDQVRILGGGEVARSGRVGGTEPEGYPSRISSVPSPTMHDIRSLFLSFPPLIRPSEHRALTRAPDHRGGVALWAPPEGPPASGMQAHRQLWRLFSNKHTHSMHSLSRAIDHPPPVEPG
jgi:hypothetical protein